MIHMALAQMRAKFRQGVLKRAGSPIRRPPFEVRKPKPYLDDTADPSRVSLAVDASPQGITVTPRQVLRDHYRLERVPGMSANPNIFSDVLDAARQILQSAVLGEKDMPTV